MSMIDSLLKKIDAPSTPMAKTGSASPTSPSLDAALATAIAGLSTEKTGSVAPSAANPVAALMKVANEVAESDAEANVKLAHRMGVAFVDAQVERMAQYEKAAAELGGTDAEKQAAYEQGFNETAALIHKTAAAHFVIGHDAVIAAIEKR